MTEHEPIREVENGCVWYFEGEDADLKCKHEGRFEIYPNWVRLWSPTSSWVPRERVEVISEV